MVGPGSLDTQLEAVATKLEDRQSVDWTVCTVILLTKYVNLRQNFAMRTLIHTLLELALSWVLCQYWVSPSDILHF